MPFIAHEFPSNTPLFAHTSTPPHSPSYPPAALCHWLPSCSPRPHSCTSLIDTASLQYPRGLTGISPAVTHTCRQNRTSRKSGDPVLCRLIPAWCRPLGYVPLGLQAWEHAPPTECMVFSYTKPAVVRYLYPARGIMVPRRLCVKLGLEALLQNGNDEQSLDAGFRIP
jgi:hypothetical protein